MNKMGLDTFLMRKENVLDPPIDKLINSLKTQLMAASSEYQKLIKLERKNPEEFRKLEEKDNLRGKSLHARMINYFQEIIYLEDELFVLFEMKIIHSFKFLEITIKQLLSAAYEDNSIKLQFRLESIGQFLKSKNILIKDINDYENIEQLRNVNNSLKHSEKDIDQRIKKIQEFKNKNKLNYINLESFYTRIKNSPGIFLSSLVHYVFQDLYSFPHERIFELAKSYALRMDKKDAIVLTEELLRFYE